MLLCVVRIFMNQKLGKVITREQPYLMLLVTNLLSGKTNTEADKKQDETSMPKSQPREGD